MTLVTENILPACSPEKGGFPARGVPCLSTPHLHFRFPKSGFSIRMHHLRLAQDAVATLNQYNKVVWSSGYDICFTIL